MSPRALLPAVHVQDRLEFETLIADTSAALLAAAPEHVDAAIEMALDRVREFFCADRCALLSVEADRSSAHVRLARYADGVSRVPPEVNLVNAFPWAARKVLSERVPVRVSSLADLPPEASQERPSWESMGIRSCLLLPIETGAAIRHLIVIHTVHGEQHWPDALVTRLRLLGELFAGCLDRRAMVAELRETEARLSSGADLAGLAHYEVDYARGSARADDRFFEICGTPPDERQGLQAVRFWMEHVHPDDRARVLATRELLHDGKLETLEMEYRYLHPARGERWIHHLARVSRRGPGGRLAASYGVFRDITEGKHADEELADLSRRLIHAQEEERAMIARELHDDVTQRLAVLAIDAGRAELAAASGEQAEAMRVLRDGLVRISEDVHSLAYELHSSVLEELGLVEALRAACERLGRRTRVEVSLDLDPKADRLGRDVALCVFRVAQEALNNVARHARARVARVSLKPLDAGVLLAVRDDGVGFDPTSPATRNTLGLASMRERLRLVHGTLDIESAPGSGTAVIAWVPAREARP
ncbi:MAG: PAS domain-containing protein [Anaeromyxobacteraceae bacterium]